MASGGSGITFRLTLAIALVFVIIGIFAFMLATQTASASSKVSGPYRTEAWATMKLKHVHRWYGVAIDPSWSNCDFGGQGNFLYPKLNSRGEEVYRKFHCDMQNAGYDSFRDFSVTLYTSWSWPYYRVVAGNR
jgi:hypothetical protein